jgi:phosphoribosylanthranilate isomerase
MKLKVCGMKYPENLKAVAALKPDYMGFIFYEKSPRNVEVTEIQETLSKLDHEINTVGVFVNHPVKEVISICQTLDFDYAQLHGNESPEYVAEIKESGIGTFKVFHMDDAFDWNKLSAYTPHVDFFLFDTKTPGYGGSGKKFNWKKLDQYKGDVPFFLSGGIGVEDIHEIKKLKHPALWGIDVNSRLEVEPGRKDVGKVGAVREAISSGPTNRQGRGGPAGGPYGKPTNKKSP